MKIAVGCDHGAFDMKCLIIEHLKEQGHEIMDFGSYDKFKADFINAAVSQFGSGWAWLAEDKDNGKLVIIKTANGDNPIAHGLIPIIGLDVWEHAYYIDYRNRRAEFIEKCWGLIHWEKVAQRMHDDILIAHIADMAEAKAGKDMDRYVCITCGWVYDPSEGDPESGIAPGTPFKDIPEEWVCPLCGVGKDMFEKVEE